MKESSIEKTFLTPEEIGAKRSFEGVVASLEEANEMARREIAERRVRLLTVETAEQREILEAEIRLIEAQIDLSEDHIRAQRPILAEYEKLEARRKKHGALGREVPQA
jgi:hypothetical protein